MNAFSKNQRFEELFTDRLIAGLRDAFVAKGWFLARTARDGGQAKQSLDVELQRKMGDLSVFDAVTNRFKALVDLKVERLVSRNMFWELLSNGTPSPERFKEGWGVNIEVDKIWYAFDDANVVAILDLKELRKWLGEVIQCPNSRSKKMRWMTYQSKLQTTHEQLNQTVGHLVPFSAMPANVFKSGYLLTDGPAKVISSAEFVQIVEAAWKARMAVESKKER